MPVQKPILNTIEDFLAQKRIAMIGVSRDPASFSAKLLEDLSRRGYEIVPVNPSASEILGRHCYPRVQDIQPPVDAALLMTSPEATATTVEDCAEAGIKRVWMYRAAGKGAVSDKALEFCGEHGISVVPGECPLMFLKGGNAIHHLHSFFRKITGSYPKRAHA
jgi:uncharacterized protein